MSEELRTERSYIVRLCDEHTIEPMINALDQQGASLLHVTYCGRDDDNVCLFAVTAIKVETVGGTPGREIPSVGHDSGELDFDTDPNAENTIGLEQPSLGKR